MPILVFLFYYPFYLIYRFNDLLYRLNDIISRLNEICCFDFRSNFLVSVSFLINIGKEMSLRGSVDKSLLCAFWLVCFVSVVVVIEIKVVKILYALAESEPKVHPKQQREKLTNIS